MHLLRVNLAFLGHHTAGILEKVDFYAKKIDFKIAILGLFLAFSAQNADFSSKKIDFYTKKHFFDHNSVFVTYESNKKL